MALDASDSKYFLSSRTRGSLRETTWKEFDMFEDDRGRLVQIGEWVSRLEEGLANRSALSDEVIWWRLSRIEQCIQRLSRPYIARHHELAELKLPSIEQVLNEPPPSLPLAIALAERTVATFKPLLTSLPPPPLPRPPRPRADSRRDEVLTNLRHLEPHLRERGISALYLFGSVARREDTADSDVDLAFQANVPREGGMGLLDRSGLTNELQRALNSSVDLVDVSNLNDDVRERVNRDMIKVFGDLS